MMLWMCSVIMVVLFNVIRKRKEAGKWKEHTYVVSSIKCMDPAGSDLENINFSLNSN